MKSGLFSKGNTLSAGRPQPTVRALTVERGTELWGAQHYLLKLKPKLEAHGIEQILVCIQGSDMEAAWRSATGRTVALPAQPPRGMRGPRGQLHLGLAAREALRTWRAARHIARLAISNRVDLIQANSHWAHLETALAGRLARVPCVLHLHEESKNDFAGKLRGLAVLLATHTVTVSEAVERTLPSWGRRRVTVVRNGIDSGAIVPAPPKASVRQDLTPDPAAAVVLVLCRIEPAKNIDHVIRAVASLPQRPGSPVRLAIAGSPDDPALRELGQELLGDRVRFLGHRSDPEEVLKACQVLVLASSTEGLPLSVLEAQAYGVPVVAYPVGGIPEVVVDGETGLLVPHGDVAGLSAAIAKVLTDQDLRTKIIEAARRQTESRNDIRIQVGRLTELVHRVVAG